ncbi:MAG: squalene--hopene cyclase [Tannerella sp.]|jgi:squalene-hopene/tetraprenyl-beta-curcumene cyclase|nr:squalene--hopene cyclase [Tannerella sp.]
MKEEQISEMLDVLSERLLLSRSANGLWRGKLSSSAISTAVSIFALYSVDKDKYRIFIQNGTAWLHQTMLPDGAWGDTTESPPNMTATLLAYVALHAADKPSEKTKKYLFEKFGGLTDGHIIQGVLSHYGKDLTFSVPILSMCALAGIIHSWDEVPKLPFELAVLPQRFFRFLRLPVVSYAIPALIAVGVLRHRKGKRGLLYRWRERFVTQSLKVLEKLQPAHGGFLEAAPLTAFVTMCMTGAGFVDHPTTQRCVGFLTDTVRDDGAWAIDTDLASWVTALSICALGNRIGNKEELSHLIRNNAFKEKHPFTGAKEGGWGWTDLQGAVPDADDTAGALVALHILLDGKICPEIEKGIEWLLDLQNSDGGIPTFCKGWGKLPFDRSSPDITAHAILAFELWRDTLPEKINGKVNASMKRMLLWMKKNQQPDGSWNPLWFGDQNAKDERSPVYGTAVAVEHLNVSSNPAAKELAVKAAAYLVSAQNKDNGWGGTKGVCSKITLTAKAISALSAFSIQYGEVVEKGFDYLYSAWKSGELEKREPIGLYFARLWYSEELYNITFVLTALNNLVS